MFRLKYESHINTIRYPSTAKVVIPGSVSVNYTNCRAKEE